MKYIILLIDAAGKVALHSSKNEPAKEFAALKQGGTLPAGFVRAELWSSEKGRINIAVPVAKQPVKPTIEPRKSK